MSDFNDNHDYFYDENCLECNGEEGNHDPECPYHRGGGYAGGNSADAIAHFIFCIFLVIGVLLMIGCPPLGAALIWLGAYLTGE